MPSAGSEGTPGLRIPHRSTEGTAVSNGTSHIRHKTSGVIPRRSAVRAAVIALTLSLGALTPAGAAGQPADRAVVEAVEQHAHRLRTTEPGTPGRDLTALVALAQDASIVGVGEATHGSRELFQLKDRIFRQLVTKAGYTTFSLETSWSSGVRLDQYIRTGQGDLRQIMREEFQGSYADWNNEQFLNLFTWMRAHNRDAAPGEQVRVMGNDVNDADPRQYERILAWTAEHRPALLPELRRRYAALLALPAGMGERTKKWLAMPQEERKALDRDASAVYRLLERSGAADPWVLQEARVIAQMTSVLSLDLLDPVAGAEANRLRDRAMAENTVWWQRHTGGKVLVSAHNAHLGYESAFPASHPVVQGAYFRELVGREYLAVGTTIQSGEYWATDTRTGEPGVFSTGPAAPGSNEHTLDRVRHRDYYVDLRRVKRDPAAARWLDGARPTFVVPSGYPSEPLDVSLGRSFDVLVHLHHVQAMTHPR
ncbi:erythromycin esterase family protein [Streptomyces katsurahamanus]|uniref:Erythromycin esterase family protein n=1 Tax=Streptomyces katsurahamanus TaxID=2577098 RepID=A0ABW9P152_9ACTN|nr:erythromycin esterase family protein [Streptomyces katsurahamanus]